MLSKFLPARRDKKNSHQENSAEINITAHPVIDLDECIGCGICVGACKRDVLEIVSEKATIVREENCIGCGRCKKECTMGAITEIGFD